MHFCVFRCRIAIQATWVLGIFVHLCIWLAQGPPWQGPMSCLTSECSQARRAQVVQGVTQAVAGMCRELYGRGLIGSLKASTWYQQLQEKQKAAAARKPAREGIRVQVGLLAGYSRSQRSCQSAALIQALEPLRAGTLLLRACLQSGRSSARPNMVPVHER